MSNIAIRRDSEKYYERVNTDDVMQAEIERLRAERDALHAALREVAITYDVLGQEARRCYLCGEGWSKEPERHAPDCLATPR